MRRKVERVDPPCKRRDRVCVREPNIRPWIGHVTAVKWSSVSGWWVDVVRDDDRLSFVMPSDLVERRASCQQTRV